MNTDLGKYILAAKYFSQGAHFGQTRKDGKTPYHTHPRAVALKVPLPLRPAAFLHDVLEDTPVTADVLRTIFPEEIVDLVEVLTRRYGETYDGYMDRVTSDRDAMKIKLEDMRHNIASDPSPSAKARMKYWIPVLEYHLGESSEDVR